VLHPFARTNAIFHETNLNDLNKQDYTVFSVDIKSKNNIEVKNLKKKKMNKERMKD
jgi:hypothetical protein